MRQVKDEETYVKDEIVGELEVRQLLIELGGERIGLGASAATSHGLHYLLALLGNVKHGGGELVVADANELLQQLIDLGDGLLDVGGGLILNHGGAVGLHAQGLARLTGLQLGLGVSHLAAGSNGIC